MSTGRATDMDVMLLGAAGEFSLALFLETPGICKKGDNEFDRVIAV